MQDYIARYGFGNTQAIVDYAYALVTKYGEGSAALAAEMYDETAALSGQVLPPAVVADTANYGEVAKAIYGTIKRSKNPSSCGSTVSRYVKMAGADTTLKNAERDGAQFAWVPMGDTCSFCLTLASRGWQYMSRKAMKNGHAEHIHANCDCTYSIRFDSKSGVKGYDPDKYLAMYNNAEGNTPKEKINSMRRMQYQDPKVRAKIQEQKKIAYDNRQFEDVKKNFLLGAKDHSGNVESEKIYLGKISDEKKPEALNYFKEQIRDRDIENAIVIQANGEVYQFIGVEDAVNVQHVKTDGANILHNHPASNGIVSFGKDDFEYIQDNQKAIYDLCNPVYDYHLEVLKDLSEISYKDASNMVTLNLEELAVCDDLQHEIMVALSNNGYIKYERRIGKKT